VKPRYPVYVPTKGRAAAPMTIRTLQRDGVPVIVVVEPAQAEAYAPLLTDRDRLLLTRDGIGLLATRNLIRDHAEADGAARHWQLDDNISNFYRAWEGIRVPAHAGVALRVAEDFADRFENVGVAGLNYDMFAPPHAVRAPYFRNCHVYSCTLVDHAMPFRWRLRYNDDTDLCLQALTGGWATIATNVFTAKKETTMRLPGGNTDGLYRAEEEQDARDTTGRFEMARVLERAWPGVVKVTRKFGRYQHSVDWAKFADSPALRLRADVDLDALPETDEYGLELIRVRDVRSPRIVRLHETYRDTLREVDAPDMSWRGLPAFRPVPVPPRLALDFASEEDRDRLVAQLGVTVDKRFKDKAWSARWPPQGRNDPASLRFDVARGAA
jgi:hypothetical protein